MDVQEPPSCETKLRNERPAVIRYPEMFWVLRAGAKSVIATLWKVDDEATAKLMTHFYSRMHQGESPASALRHAQIEVSKDERWSHPYYWAAFVFQGDYRLSGLN
jgi:CHAT domain-containing protein